MENEYGTVDFNITPHFDTTTGVIGDYVPESNHPVLAKLYERIAELETSNAQLEKTSNDLRESNQSLNTRYYDVYSNFANYKYKLENVLRTFAQDNSASAELFVEVANEMDIELNNVKEYEITVRWKITVAAPFDEEIELSEYDIDTHINSIGGLDFEVDDVDTSIDEI